MKTPIETILDGLEYTPTNAEPSLDGLPHVTHEGKLKIEDVEITVYVLSTGERIIPAEEFAKLI